MNARLAVVTVLLGSLIVILSQLVTAYTLEDPYGINMSNVTLIEKHGPLTAVLAVLAGLAAIFLVTTAARATEATRPVALGTGIFIAGMGFAIILVFLLVDLPDVGDTGLYDAPGAGNLDATGSSAAGLWMELLGGLILLLGGAALSTLNEIQLRTIGPRRKSSDPQS